jgi:hypothetical protein
VAIRAVEVLVEVRELGESRLLGTGIKVEEQRELTRRLEKLEALLQSKDAS